MKKKMMHVMLSVVMLLGLLFGNWSFAADKFTRQDVQIKSNGLNMAGWLYIPSGLAQGEKRPAIGMAHGWSAVKEMYLDDYAAKFASNGFVHPELCKPDPADRRQTGRRRGSCGVGRDGGTPINVC